jgi:Kef-type K+ transport system membrane component KefB
MVSRGEVGLIVAGVGINQGMVSSAEFSAVVAMVLITTLVTPPILRSLFAHKEREDEQTTTFVEPQSKEAN